MPTPASENSAALDVCIHCGGELGRGWRPEDGPFCCRGCRSVHALIHSSGLDRYYELRQGRQAPPAVLRPDSFAWLDQLLDQQQDQPGHGSQNEMTVRRLTLDIQGVHCAACIWLLENLFQREEGGLDLRINPSLGKVDLVWDTARGDLKHYLAEVEKFGYRLGPSRKEVPQRSRALLARMAVCIAVALNVMMFSVSYYLGLAPADGALYTFFGRLSLFLATVSVIIGGQVFFKGAIAGLRRGLAHLDLPISLGMILAYAGSIYGYITSGPEAAYFDSLTIFVALMLVGRWAQEHILERNRHALLAAEGAENITVKRQRDGSLEAVSAPDILTGDELWIAPGDLVPVAGILLRKDISVSLDWITGESDPVSFTPGDTVPAGAFNTGLSGFVVTATEDFAESRLQELLRTQPGSSAGSGDQILRWWSRVSSYYVAVVLSLATLGFAIWVGRGLQTALEVTVAILVVTCPCALGLATPLAQELTHSALRRRGIFLRREDFLDRALAVRKILLDKTGTLTLGELVLTPESRKALWQLAEADKQKLSNMTARSNHPVSKTLAAAVGTTGVFSDISTENVVEQPGLGLEWRLTDRIYRLGHPGFAGVEPPIPNTSTRETGRSTVFSVDGMLLAVFHFDEEFKADAVQELKLLQDQGYDIHLLSGDAPAKVAAAATTLGIATEKAVGGMTPESKARRVQQLDAGDTLMVGDGLNDSPSFAAAHCAATPAVDRPVLPSKADFYFLGDGISALRRALASARQLRKVVRDNLVLAIIYNVLAVSLCMVGLVTPVVAAVLMPLSSVTIVGLTAWRLSGRRLAWMS